MISISRNERKAVLVLNIFHEEVDIEYLVKTILGL